MKNGKEPIYPDPMRGAEQSFTNQTPHDLPIGLTKREYFAIHILSGMNANGMTTQEGVQPPYCMLIEERVKYAVEQADALLAELEKNQ
jgi:hypothetical protein